MGERTPKEIPQPPIEIERKFLVLRNPINLYDCPSTDIAQGYVVVTDDGTEVRVRRKGVIDLGKFRYFQTVKSGGGKTRNEVEFEITEEQFEALWQLTEGRRIEKTRYKVPSGDQTIEIDFYKGDLRGLVTAEIEFDSEEASNEFIPPSWLGEEVTEDKRYKNQSLALHGRPLSPNEVEDYIETLREGDTSSNWSDNM